ncbi:MAG: TolC family protein, partial [Candidatus Eremiobacteraeota bacterium]|nr:TolC family protein [Candidatus Eremiobacteraeota bacterium]
DIQLLALQPMSFSGDRKIYLDRALEQHPQITAARERWHSAKQQLAAVQARYLPAITGNVQNYTGRSTPPLGSTGYQIGATVSMMLFDGGSRSAEIAQARAKLDRAGIELERVQLSVQRDVLNAWRDFEAAQNNLKTARTAQADAAEQLRVATIRVRAGKAIELEVIDALDVDAQAREKVLEAMARFNSAVAAIHHAAGDASI